MISCEELLRLATELKQAEARVFAPGKHTETEVVYMRPRLRIEIIAALREAAAALKGGH